jgi:hypothetical protein
MAAIVWKVYCEWDAIEGRYQIFMELVDDEGAICTVRLKRDEELALLEASDVESVPKLVGKKVWAERNDVMLTYLGYCHE